MSLIRPKILIPPEMVPVSGLNAYFQYVSAARQAMLTGNFSQALICDGRTRKRQQTGLEREIAKATFSHAFPRDAVVLNVIPRFSSIMRGESFNINPMDLVIYEDYETHQLDVIELTKFHVMHQHYGFEFEFDPDVYDKLVKNAKFEAGTVIAKSPAVTADGDYMYGLETNVVMLSDPAVTEDGVVYSRSYANRIRATGYESRVVTFGRSHYPINLYGNADVYKPIPDIGEKIHSNGLLCAIRPYHPIHDTVYMSRKKLFKPVFGFDTPTYGIPDATIVDIKVLHNDRLPNPRLPEMMGEQFRKYHEADKRFAVEMIRTCLYRNGRLNRDVDLSPRLRALLFEAIAKAGDDLIDEGMWPKNDAEILRVRENYRGELLDEYRAEIIYQYKTSIGEGPKVTDQHGGKGVCSAIWEDEDMPTDDFGNRADVAIAAVSTLNRQNEGRTHEQLVGATGRDIIKRIRRSYGLPDMGEIPLNVIKDTVLAQNNHNLALTNFAYLLGFYAKMSPNRQYKLFTKAGVIERGRHLSHLIAVIQDGDLPYGLYLQIPSNSGVYMDEVVDWIENSVEYCPEMSQVTYKDLSGKKTRTKEKVLIGPNYYLALEKTATDWSGVGSSKVNHFGVTARLTNADKYSSPGRQTVTRSVGESEARNLAQAMGADPVANIMDMNNNPVIHKEVCNTIMTVDNPADIESVVDRELFALGGHRPAGYAQHQLLCSGKNIVRP